MQNIWFIKWGFLVHSSIVYVDMREAVSNDVQQACS